jgi:hypothetical protein
MPSYASGVTHKPASAGGRMSYSRRLCRPSFLSVFLTVSWETDSTMPISTALSAKLRMLQRSRPSGASEQASAIRRASATVGRVRERFFMQGRDAALERSMSDRLYERTFVGSRAGLKHPGYVAV